MRANRSAAAAAVGGPLTWRPVVDPPEAEEPMDEVEELLLMEC